MTISDVLFVSTWVIEYYGELIGRSEFSRSALTLTIHNLSILSEFGGSTESSEPVIVIQTSGELILKSKASHQQTGV